MNSSHNRAIKTRITRMTSVTSRSDRQISTRRDVIFEFNIFFLLLFVKIFWVFNDRAYFSDDEREWERDVIRSFQDPLLLRHYLSKSRFIIFVRARVFQTIFLEWYYVQRGILIFFVRIKKLFWLFLPLIYRRRNLYYTLWWFLLHSCLKKKDFFLTNKNGFGKKREDFFRLLNFIHF